MYWQLHGTNLKVLKKETGSAYISSLMARHLEFKSLILPFASIIINVKGTLFITDAPWCYYIFQHLFCNFNTSLLDLRSAE